MALSRFLSTFVPGSPAPSLQQVLILLIFFVVIVLVARFIITNISGSVKIRVPGGLETFARFFYASFLKSHSGDGTTTGQQAALESFYKAQVAFPFTTSQSFLDRSVAMLPCHNVSRRSNSSPQCESLKLFEQAKVVCHRPMSTMQLGRDFSEAEKIC